MASRDGLDAILGFIDDRGVGGFEHIVDETGEIWAEFGVASQPSFVFIDDDGTTDRHIGALGETGIAAAVEELLAS